MKKIALTLIAGSILVGCGGGGGGGSKPKEVQPSENDLKKFSSDTNLKQGQNLIALEDRGYFLSDSLLDAEKNFESVFNDVTAQVIAAKVVSSNVVLLSLKHGDNDFKNLIAYIDKNAVYEIGTGKEHVGFFQSKAVGNSVVILGNREFIYISNGKKHHIRKDDLPTEFKTDGKYIAFFDRQYTKSGELVLNVSSLDKKVDFKITDKFLSLLAVDNGEVILSMDDDFYCHPMESGVIPDLKGNFKHNCDVMDTTNPIQNLTNTQIELNMRHLVKVGVSDEKIEPLALITVPKGLDRNSLTYHAGYVFHGGIKQKVRNQDHKTSIHQVTYKGKDIGLVDYSDFCNQQNRTRFDYSPVGFIKNNILYCFENNSVIDKSNNPLTLGVRFTVSKLDSKGDYIREPYKTYGIFGKTSNSAYDFFMYNNSFAFTLNNSIYTYNFDTAMPKSATKSKNLVDFIPMQEMKKIN